MNHTPTRARHEDTMSRLELELIPTPLDPPPHSTATTHLPHHLTPLSPTQQAHNRAVLEAALT